MGCDYNGDTSRNLGRRLGTGKDERKKQVLEQTRARRAILVYMSIEKEAAVSEVFELMGASGLSGSNVRTANLTLLRGKLEFGKSMASMRVTETGAVPVTGRQRDLLKQAQALKAERDAIQARLEEAMQAFLNECDQES